MPLAYRSSTPETIILLPTIVLVFIFIIIVIIVVINLQIITIVSTARSSYSHPDHWPDTTVSR